VRGLPNQNAKENSFLTGRTGNRRRHLPLTNSFRQTREKGNFRQFLFFITRPSVLAHELWLTQESPRTPPQISMEEGRCKAKNHKIMGF
jgi:hypothetical protein